MFPYGYGSSSVELSQRQLHVKERHATKDGHQNVGNEESTCTEIYEGTYGFNMVVTRRVSAADKVRPFIKSKLRDEEGLDPD